MWENDHVTRDILVVMKMGWRHQSDFNDNRVGKWGFDSMKMVEFFLSFQTKKGDVSRCERGTPELSDSTILLHITNILQTVYTHKIYT